MKEKTTELYEELDTLNDWIHYVADECGDIKYVDLDKWPPTSICKLTGKTCCFDCCPKRKGKTSHCDKSMVVIVNDCAHVMEDLIPYLKNDFDITFIQRSRGLWSKTFGVLWKILRSHGNIFHVSYALQDAYLVSKFKHLDILHIHGGDVRWAIHSKKYGWIVKHNLKHAKKVLYATPDLEQTIKKFRSDPIYLPTPVKTNIFNMKNNYNNCPRAVYFKLAYEELPTELMKALTEREISLTVMQRTVPYEKMPETLQAFDIYIDRFTVPSLSKTCLEAMSCGLATVTYQHMDVLEQRINELSDIRNIKKIGNVNRRFIKEKHGAPKIAEQLSKIWRESL